MDAKETPDKDNIPSTSKICKESNAKRTTRRELDDVINAVFDNATRSSSSDSDEEYEMQSDIERINHIQIVGHHCLLEADGNIGRMEAQKSTIRNRTKVPVDDNKSLKISKQYEQKIVSKYSPVKGQGRAEAPKLKIENVSQDLYEHMFATKPRPQGSYNKIGSKHRLMKGDRMYEMAIQKSKSRSLSKLNEGKSEEKMMLTSESKSLTKLSEDIAVGQRLNHNVSQLLAVFDLTKSETDGSKQKIFEQCAEPTHPGKSTKVERVFLAQNPTDVDREVPETLQPFDEVFEEESDTTTDSSASSAHTVVGVVSGEPPSMQVLQLEGSETGDTDTDTDPAQSKMSEFLIAMHKSFDNSSSSPPQVSPTKMNSRVKVIVTRFEGDKLEQKKLVNSRPQDDQRRYVTKSRFLTQAEIDHIDKERNVRLEQREMRRVEQEKAEISERFKQIMIMFDNFTKNLESLDTLKLSVPEPSYPHCSPRSSSSSSPEPSIDLCPRVHRSRYDCYVQDVIKRAKDSQKSVPIKIPKRRQSGKPPTVEEIFPLEQPLYKEIATSISGIYLHSEHEPDARDLSVLSSGGTTDAFNIPSSSASASLSGEHEVRVHSVAKSSKATSEPSTTRTVVINSQPTLHNLSHQCTVNDIAKTTTTTTTTTTTNNKITDEATYTLSSGMQNAPLKRLNSEGSGLTLAKISQPVSRQDIAPILHAPCERTYHTIHIEATSTPSSSMLHRPPLCMRLWNVLTDFCAAICLCLQVNKDCIFCLGFFIAFVVSASFLTAFFYRTLSISPQIYQQQPQQVVLETNSLPTAQRDSDMFYI